MRQCLLSAVSGAAVVAVCLVCAGPGSAAATCEAHNPRGAFPDLADITLRHATCAQARRIGSEIQRYAHARARTGVHFPATADGFRCRYIRRRAEDPYVELIATRGRARITMALTS